MLYSTNETYKIFYAQYGSAEETIIMVHGNGENHSIFAAAAKILGNDYTVILPDSPGHGASYHPHALHYHAIACDYIELLNHLNIKQPIFYGFSDGGIIGLLMAIKQPGIFKKLIISGVNTQPEGIKNYLLTFYKVMDKIKPDPLTKLMLTEPNISDEELQTITIPTVVLVGEKDIIKAAHTQNLVHQIPKAQLEIIPHEGHGSYIINNIKIAEIIKKYL